VGAKSDPRRLPRRNHFQEGPGFLFLATENGRPPATRAPDRLAAVVRRRRAALRAWTEGAALTEVCARYDCGRASLFRWRDRFAAEGLTGLLDRYHPTRRSELPAEVERVVITVRLLTYWNSKRIAAEFRRREIWPISHAQIDRLFDRCGTHRSTARRLPGPRYERDTVNELWHIDLKGPFFFQRPGGGPGRCHFIGLVDDFSRFLLGIRAVPSLEAEALLRFFAETIELCGVPLALMSDNGSPFVAITKTMLNRFQRTLEELAIRHIRTQIDTPWTNGKIEAFWATLQAEVLDRHQFADLAAAEAAALEYAGYYNYHRLHGEIGWLTPAERFDGTPFTDRGFQNIPTLSHLVPRLAGLRSAA
jgi:transposase InsO family protein